MNTDAIPFPADEAKTILVYVLPILRRLGWDDEDPEQVEAQHSTGSGSVDFSLTAGKNRAFVEVKRAGTDLEGGEEQLLRYCFDEGAEVAVITNGERWSLFLPSRTEVRWQDRKFRTIDVKEQEAAEVAELLEKFLARSRVKSGKALVAAREDFEEKKTKEAIGKAIATIPDAWDDIVSRSDQTLADLVNDAVERLCNSRAPAKDISKFLAGLSAPPLVAPTTRRRSSRTRRAPKTDSYIGTKPRAFVLRGKPAVEVRSWRELLTELSRLIHSNHKTEFSKCLELGGAKKKYFSKGSPDPSMYGPHRIPETSYYVETYFNADHMVRVAHQLIELFGYKPSDLKIETL